MKGKDELGNFIRANRDAFDDREAPASVWNNINRTLHPGADTRWWNNLNLWRAAAVIFLAISIYLVLPRNAREENTQLAMKEFRDVEAFYIGEISQKVQMIESISEGDAADDFTQDFQQLEAMYLVLKEELKSRPSKKVKDALVLNLLVRINLLNQQLHRLEQDYNEEEKEERAST